MSVTCNFAGRMGNCIYNVAAMIAYCKKNNLQYYVPTEANHYKRFIGDNKMPFTIPSTGEAPINPTVYREPVDENRYPFYKEIPPTDNVVLTGYYQSFNYFDWCRDYILDTFNFPYEMNKGVVSISVRRGDCVGSPHFPLAPREYYENAIRYMQDRGYNDFHVFSDDIAWCMQEFNQDNYYGANFYFSVGKTEYEDFIAIQNCDHNIIARSTFSLTAAWFNRNPDKIVLVPTTKHKWWTTQNLDLIPDYFTQIEF